MDIREINSDFDLEIYKKQCDYKIYAGPGAGKTYLLIKNIKNIIDHSDKLKQDNRKILCITYTNAAAEEIKARLGNYDKYVYISTIHSFIYDKIIKQNQIQLKILIKNIFNIELDNLCILKPRQEGYRLLSKDDEIKIRKFIEENSEENFENNISRTKIESCIFDIAKINKYPFNNNATVEICSKYFSKELAYWIKYAIFAEAQKIDFNEILFLGYKLLKNFKHIPYLLQYEFPYVFVDEYQDTNPIQNAILKCFADNKEVSQIVIGDIAQSIYNFQGATYEEFQNYNSNTKTVLEFVINGNRRSTENIIHMNNFIRQADEKLKLQECVKNLSKNEKIKIITFNRNEDILSKVPIDSVVLCRKWADVFQYIRGVSKEQKRLINSIQNFYAYTYKKDFFTEMEQHKIDWIKISNYIVNVKNAMSKKCLASIINYTKEFFDIDVIIKPSEEQALNFKKFIGFIEKFNLITSDMKLNKILEQINLWKKELDIDLIEDFSLLKEGDEYYNKNLYTNVNNLEYGTLEKMFNDVFNKDAKFLTIHRSKGLEYEKELINFSPTRNENTKMQKAQLTLTGMMCNPKIFDKNMDKDLTEFMRIIYVGCSRAKDELYISLNEDINKEDLNRELDKYIKKYKVPKFYEFI